MSQDCRGPAKNRKKIDHEEGKNPDMLDKQGLYK